MKKRQQLITGILISAMAFSTITKPEVVQASPQKSVSAYAVSYTHLLLRTKKSLQIYE